MAMSENTKTVGSQSIPVSSVPSSHKWWGIVVVVLLVVVAGFLLSHSFFSGKGVGVGQATGRGDSIPVSSKDVSRDKAVDLVSSERGVTTKSDSGSLSDLPADALLLSSCGPVNVGYTYYMDKDILVGDFIGDKACLDGGITLDCQGHSFIVDKVNKGYAMSVIRISNYNPKYPSIIQNCVFDNSALLEDDNNQFGIKGIGIVASEKDGVPKGITIKNNKFIDFTYAIYAYGKSFEDGTYNLPSDIKVVSNIFQGKGMDKFNTGFSGSIITDIVLQDNVFTDYSSAISLGGPQGPQFKVFNVNLMGNTVTHSGIGIDVGEKVSNLILDNNIVTENKKNIIFDAFDNKILNAYSITNNLFCGASGNDFDCSVASSSFCLNMGDTNYADKYSIDGGATYKVLKTKSCVKGGYLPACMSDKDCIKSTYDPTYDPAYSHCMFDFISGGKGYCTSLCSGGECPKGLSCLNDAGNSDFINYCVKKSSGSDCSGSEKSCSKPVCQGTVNCVKNSAAKSFCSSVVDATQYCHGDTTDFGARCEKDSDCTGGFCVWQDPQDSSKGSVCTKSCVEDCPNPGWACKKTLKESDVVSFCFPQTSCVASGKSFDYSTCACTEFNYGEVRNTKKGAELCTPVKEVPTWLPCDQSTGVYAQDAFVKGQTYGALCHTNPSTGIRGWYFCGSNDELTGVVDGNVAGYGIFSANPNNPKKDYLCVQKQGQGKDVTQWARCGIGKANGAEMVIGLNQKLKGYICTAEGWKEDCLSAWQYAVSSTKVGDMFKGCVDVDKNGKPWCAIRGAYVSGKNYGTDYRYCANAGDTTGCVLGDWYYGKGDGTVAGPFNGCTNEDDDNYWCATKLSYVKGDKFGSKKRSCDSSESAAPSKELCYDGIDNDFDGYTDCSDPDCSLKTACLSMCDETYNPALPLKEYGANRCANRIYQNFGLKVGKLSNVGCYAIYKNVPIVSDDGGKTYLFIRAESDQPSLTSWEYAKCPVTFKKGSYSFGSFTSLKDAKACIDEAKGNLFGDKVSPFYKSEECDDAYMKKVLEEEGPYEKECGDGKDNDNDGKIDCADSDCNGAVVGPKSQWCQSLKETQCADGFDNDGDGKVDCADSDCTGNVVNKGDNGCTASTCMCVSSEVSVLSNPGACTDGYDNDGDGKVDCDDEGCASYSACAKSVILGNACVKDEQCSANQKCTLSNVAGVTAKVCIGVEGFNCKIDDYCAKGYTCVEGKCTNQVISIKKNGESCSLDSDCQSKFCSSVTHACASQGVTVLSPCTISEKDTTTQSLTGVTLRCTRLSGKYLWLVVEGGSCTQDGECTTSYCRDGVCASKQVATSLSEVCLPLYIANGGSGGTETTWKPCTVADSSTHTGCAKEWYKLQADGKTVNGPFKGCVNFENADWCATKVVTKNVQKSTSGALSYGNGVSCTDYSVSYIPSISSSLLLGDTDGNGCLTLSEYTAFKKKYKNNVDNVQDTVTLPQYNKYKKDFKNNADNVQCS